jgi:micrococcal nuclease
MTDEGRACPTCGQRRAGYFRFCSQCGFDYDELAARAPAPVPQPPSLGPIPDPNLTAPVVPVLGPDPAPQPVVAVPNLESVTVAGWVPPAPIATRRLSLSLKQYVIVGLALLLGANAISDFVSPSTTPAGRAAPGAALATTTPVDTSTTSAEPTFGPTGPTEIAVVTRIVDGDTIRVDIDRTEYPLRYIGIDTPEPDVADPAVRAFADAATAANAALVEGREVILERDVSETDQFDRLLRHVWIEDAAGGLVLVNLELIRQGFAQVSTYPPDVKYVDLLTIAQEIARTAELGLWAAAATPAPPTRPSPGATVNTLVGGGGSACHPSYSPCLPIVADLNCPDVRGLGKAPVDVKGPDEYELDRDNDGIGCE